MHKKEYYLKSVPAYYTHNNSDADVKVVFTYKGMPVNPQFVDEFPEIYPSKETIQKRYEELKNITLKNKTSFFTVTEEGFKDIEVNIGDDFSGIV